MGNMYVSTSPSRLRAPGRVLLAIVLGVVLGLVAPAAPADAAKRTRVSISAPSAVNLPSAALVSGTVSGRSIGATVILRKQVGGEWQAIQTGVVSLTRTYRFSAPVAAGVNRFQVKAVKSQRLKRSGRSAAITVFGIAPVPAEVASARSQILQDTNAFRAQNGKPALKESAVIDALAQVWTQYMASTGDFRHNPVYFEQYPGDPSAGAENIGYGYTPDTIVSAWISSAGHRANLLGNYTHIGIGYARSSGGRAYFTQNFAKY